MESLPGKGLAEYGPGMRWPFLLVLIVSGGMLSASSFDYDNWAASYGLDPTANGAPTADPDGDGSSNALEYAFGTSPIQGGPGPLSITSTGGNHFSVNWLERVTGVTYEVQSTSNLSAGWTKDNAVVVVPGPTSPAPPQNYVRSQFTIAANGTKFYRLSTALQLTDSLTPQVADVAMASLSGEIGLEAQEGTMWGTPLVLPTRIGNSDPRTSKLVRWSAPAWSGFPPLFSGYVNPASNIPASATPYAGPAFAKSRWNAPRLMNSDPNFSGFTEPNWVYVDDVGPNPVPSKAIGRYAYMLYDVGGMPDINVAGVSADLPIGDKGGTAFANMDSFFQSKGGDFAAFIAWRNGTNLPTLSRYYGNPSVPGPSGMGLVENPSTAVPAGENRFLTRRDLIAAGDQGQFGLNPELVSNLRTNSTVGNRISVENLFAYGTNATISPSHLDLKATRDATFTIDRLDGTTETYTIKSGWPLFQDRFPLARLRWLADRQADGTPNHPAEIKKYFGLTWNDANKLFIYTSPDGTSPVSSIKTLKDLATRINSGYPPREPDFFEWLKAAINPDSLGQTGGSTCREFGGSPSTSVSWEVSKDLHLLRLGANIIDQSDPNSIPTGIRSQFSGVTPAPFDSFGQENLPGINEAITSVYRPNAIELMGYLQFELWNPNREAYTTARTPKGYDGRPIRAIRVGTIGGAVFMQPFVYIAASASFPKSPFGGNESNNATWAFFSSIADYSKGEHPLLNNPNAPQSMDFHSMNLTNQFIEIPLTPGNATFFFNEPAVASVFGPDFSNAAISTSYGQRLYLGATPVDKNNAILMISVHTPRVAFTGIPLSCTTSSWPDGIYKYGASGKSFSGLTQNATTSPSGSKCYNAARFYSYSGMFYGVPTAPVTLQIEVQTSGGNWIPVNRYHNLAFSMGDLGGRISGLISGTTGGSQSVSDANWRANSDTTQDFSTWTQLGIRKGYLMSDPRTERFGLSDTNEATPGQGIYPTANTSFTGSGITSNMPCGTMAAVGKAVASGMWNLSGSATSTPLVWALFHPAAGMSPPAYLARNEWTGDTANSHAYKDYDGVPRPADARWVGWGAHPALPPTSLGGTPSADILAARPTILDRPFRNVAELGCVFRDIPWKSLDLFSADSADRRLLDVFSIEDRAIVPGKINPNLVGAETLQALLRGASLDPSNSIAIPVPSSTADAVATMFANVNPTSDPVGNTANMAARLSTDFVSKPESGFSPYKTKAENFIRALSSTTDTRHWQLFADVVVQGGHLRSGSSNLADFVVDGQQRYWESIVIDRMTGEVISRQTEPVSE